MSATWTATDVVFRYPEAERAAVDGVSLTLPSGGCTALLGPNGAGKSTLLHLLLGTLVPQRGAIHFRDRPIGAWSRAELARVVGVLPQHEEAPFPMTVRDCVAMGRYPHLGPWQRERTRDRDAILDAMGRAHVLALASRGMSELSGGERQRVRLARALAQHPEAFALDEPTAALDVRHEMAIFELLRNVGRQGATVLLVTHNLNLAARYADHLVLMNEGRIAAAGAPAAVLTRAIVQRVYGWPVEIVPHRGPGPDTGAPQVVPLAGEACAQLDEPPPTP